MYIVAICTMRTTRWCRTDEHVIRRQTDRAFRAAKGQRFFLNCMGGMDIMTTLAENNTARWDCYPPLGFVALRRSFVYGTALRRVSMSLVMRYVAPAFEFFYCFSDSDMWIIYRRLNERTYIIQRSTIQKCFRPYVIIVEDKHAKMKLAIDEYSE